jgi:hypothetical protein
VGEGIEVVGGLGGGVGSDDGAAAGGEVEGNGAADAFCCAAAGGQMVGLGVYIMKKWSCAQMRCFGYERG